MILARLHLLREDEHRIPSARKWSVVSFVRPGPKSGGVPKARREVYLEGTLA